jgi:hypothetical protein
MRWGRDNYKAVCDKMAPFIESKVLQEGIPAEAEISSLQHLAKAFNTLFPLSHPYRATLSWWLFVSSGLLGILIALITISFQSIKSAITNPVKSLRME